MTADTDPRVTLYRTRSCGFCRAAEALLREHGIEFDEVYLDEHPDRRGFTASILPGHATVPLVVAGGRPIGGYERLRALDAAGELEAALRGAGETDRGALPPPGT